VIESQTAPRATMVKAIRFLLLLGVALGLSAIIATTLTSPDWTVIITAVGIGFYVTAVLMNPLLGFLLWIATAPFARFLYLNISLGRGIPDLSLDRISAGFILVLLMAQLAIRKRNLARLTRVDLVMVLFVIGSLISLPLAIAGPTATIQAYFDAQLVPLIVYFLAKNLVSNKRTSRAFLVTIALMGAYLSALVIHEQLTGVILFYPAGRTIRYTAHLRRVVGLLGNPAFFAILLAMVLPFMLHGLVQAKRRSSKAIYAILSAANLYAVYLCYNRAGWLAALLAMVYMAFFYKKFRRLFIPLLVLAGVVVAIMWPQISNSYVITERLTAEAPLDYRFNAIDIAMEMVSSNLVFGRGYGNFGFLYAKYATDWTQTRVLPAPHNTYVNIFVSSGLAGIVPFIGTFAAIALQGLALWRKGRYRQGIDRPLLVCLNAAVIVYASTIFFSDIVAIPYVTSVFYFIVGSILGYQERISRWGDPGQWLQ
jgi:O-antigen ligase